MGRRYLTRRQVRERYGDISDITVTRRIKRGELPDPLLIGNRHLFALDELEEKDREAKAAFRRAQAEPPKHTPPHRKNTVETIPD
ncbi:helix-turn-helix transcriptional regulator [Sinorhizobium meliloti]|uniref:helix-turn-helix transcriptional regulator n=1 Tax=Rhizobium meliloti TaxID=382 RepID=UPI00031344B3|nr:hypothetical protein [Sinorhizobium meliloti]MDE4601396.1 DNA-binding protein [Sinorhizobium meliloti]UDU17778.1 DNA-binding protein [Sinorhizobium meliloti]